MDSSSDSEDDFLGNIALKQRKTSASKRVTRSKMAAKRGSVDAALKTPAKKSAKAKKKADTETPTRTKVATKRGSADGLKTPAKKSAKAKKKADTETPSENSADTSLEDLNTSNTSQRQRGRGRGRNRSGGKNARMWLPMDPIERAQALSAFYSRQSSSSTAQQSSNTSQRGRGRGRGRNRARGRKRNSGRAIKMWLPMDPIERARVLSAYYARQQ